MDLIVSYQVHECVKKKFLIYASPLEVLVDKGDRTKVIVGGTLNLETILQPKYIYVTVKKVENQSNQTID